jgi:aminoglycoside N3'-acetyltransferase
MSELTTIRAGSAPVTRSRIADDLGRLGVRRGGVLLAHSSLSTLGWVCGGAQAVVEGLLDALAPDGTLVVPTHTGGNSEPADWRNPPVPRDWWPVIRATAAGRRWLSWEDVVADEQDFERLGAAFDATGRTRTGRVGEGEARLMRQRALVEFAVGWLVENR